MSAPEVKTDVLREPLTLPFLDPQQTSGRSLDFATGRVSHHMG